MPGGCSTQPAVRFDLEADVATACGLLMILQSAGGFTEVNGAPQPRRFRDICSTQFPRRLGWSQ